MAADSSSNPQSVSVSIKEEPSKTKTMCHRKNAAQKSLLVKKFSVISTIILSLFLLASSIAMLIIKDEECEKVLKLPSLQIWLAIGLLFVFLISNAAVCFRSRFPILTLIVVMVPLVLIFTTGLAFVGTFKQQSPKIVATPFWFKKQVHNSYKWENVKSCLFLSGTCNDLAARSLTLTPYDFSLKKLAPIEAGCCKPPTVCGMEFVNATYWRKPAGDDYRLQLRDCKTWSNDQTKLCFECESCKDGFVKALENKWLGLGVLFTLISLLLIISHIVLFIAEMWRHIDG